MEQAVALSPRDVGYRLLLADIYLKSGRFESARATYADVLELDPSNVRGGLSFALTQIALGRPQAAIQPLEDLAGRAPAADVGLALALAGRIDRAIELLDHAARSPTATPRTRQNLALAYAMSGDWSRARTIAAQDLSPAEVAPRMQQWAAFARPGAAPTQVAACSACRRPTIRASRSRWRSPRAAPPAAAYAEAAGAAPSRADRARTRSAGRAAEAPRPRRGARCLGADRAILSARRRRSPTSPRRSTTSPEAPAAPARRGAGAAMPPPPAPGDSAGAADPRFRRRAALPRAGLPARAPGRRGAAPVVVQLGAFSNEGNAERAWLAAARDHGLQAYRPLTTTFDMDGRTLHRVSVAGFASRADAQRLCGSIRGQGGACFVRAQAGDASIRWAARYADPRRRNV